MRALVRCLLLLSGLVVTLGRLAGPVQCVTRIADELGVHTLRRPYTVRLGALDAVLVVLLGLAGLGVVFLLCHTSCSGDMVGRAASTDARGNPVGHTQTPHTKR